MEEISNHREEVRINILKSFDTDIEKAHNHGDVHSNGKWYWESSANGGKGDWRTIKGASKAAPQPKVEEKEEDKEEDKEEKTFSIKAVYSRLQTLQIEGKIKKGWKQKVLINDFTANIRTGQISSVAPYTKGFYTFTSGGGHGRANILECEGKRSNGYVYTYGGVNKFFIPNYGDI